MKKVWALLFAAIAVTTLGFQSPAAAAPTAWPTGCSFGRWSGDPDAAWAACDRSNGGSWRALVICRNLETGRDITRSATAWRTSGDSYVFCPPMTMYRSAGIETRASS